MYRNSNIGKAEWSVCPTTIVTIVFYQLLGILCGKDLSLALKRGEKSITHCWLDFHLRDKHHTHTHILQEKKIYIHKRQNK